MVYFCYIDESGTPQIPGNTSHYVLCGLSIPVKYWKRCDKQINKIKAKYGLAGAEIHTGWIKRTYLEQSKIAGFEKLSYAARRSAVISARTAEIYRVKNQHNPKALKQLKKNFENTDSYIHLTYQERMDFLREVADAIGGWSFARIFADTSKTVRPTFWTASSPVSSAAAKRLSAFATSPRMTAPVSSVNSLPAARWHVRS